jgi:ribosomal protein S27E
VVLTLALFCGCGEAAQVRLNEERSRFSDFTVVDGNVCIACTLVIENSTGGAAEVRITASSRRM